MEPLKAVPLRDSLLDQMRRVADYIYFDGPLLTHFRGPHGASYFRYWCDTDGASNRWMIFKVPEAQRVDYIEGLTPLSKLVKNESNMFVYFVDTDAKGNRGQTLLVPMDDIPIAYLPTEDSFYKSEPVNLSEEAEHSYTVLIDEDWSLSDLGEFRRLYGRSYSFIFALMEMLPKGIRGGSIMHAFTRLPWRGGFSSMHFFNDTVGLVPPDESPQVLSMQFASPGWIELGVSLPVAELVREIAKYVGKHHRNVQQEINATYDILRGRKLLGHKGKTVHDVSEADVKVAEKLYHEFCRQTEFPLEKELLLATDNPLAALKTLISFIRRLWELNDFGSGNKMRL